MRTGKAAQVIGVNHKTITNWIDHPLLNRFFTDMARGADGRAQREITDPDLLVLNTIRAERAGLSNNDIDWQAIADVLASGRRERQMPPGAMGVDVGMTRMAQVEQSLTLVMERDAALKRVRDLEEEIIRLERASDSLKDQITDLKLQKIEELTRLQVELELWRSGRLKPD